MSHFRQFILNQALRSPLEKIEAKWKSFCFRETCIIIAMIVSANPND